MDQMEYQEDQKNEEGVQLRDEDLVCEEDQDEDQVWKKKKPRKTTL